jgi:hypothetical protein
MLADFTYTFKERGNTYTLDYVAGKMLARDEAKGYGPEGFEETVDNLLSEYDIYIRATKTYKEREARLTQMLAPMVNNSMMNVKDLVAHIAEDLADICAGAHSILEEMWGKYEIFPNPENNVGYMEHVRQATNVKDDLRCFSNVALAHRINTFDSFTSPMYNSMNQQELAANLYTKSLNSVMTMKGVGDEGLRNYNRYYFIQAWKVMTLGAGLMNKLKAAIPITRLDSTINIVATYDALSEGMFRFFRMVEMFKVGNKDFTDNVHYDYLNRIR